MRRHVGHQAAPHVVAEHVTRHYHPQRPGRLELIFARFGGIEPGNVEVFDDEDDELEEESLAEERERTEHLVALDDVSFEAWGGSCVAFVGPRRSGKSLLLKIVAGLVPPTSGRVRVHGKVSPALDATLALLPRYGRLERSLPILAATLGLSSRHVRSRLPAIWEFAGDPELRKQYASATTGKRRLVAVLSVLLQVDADIFLFDADPGSGAFADGCRARLAEARDGGALVLMTAAGRDAVAGLADRIVTMERGRIVGDEHVDRDAEARRVKPEPSAVAAVQVADA